MCVQEEENIAPPYCCLGTLVKRLMMISWAIDDRAKRVLRCDELCIHVCAPKSIKMCAACVVDKSDSERESLVCVC